jgi:hypothetical protein
MKVKRGVTLFQNQDGVTFYGHRGMAEINDKSPTSPRSLAMMIIGSPPPSWRIKSRRGSDERTHVGARRGSKTARTAQAAALRKRQICLSVSTCHRETKCVEVLLVVKGFQHVGERSP